MRINEMAKMIINMFTEEVYSRADIDIRYNPYTGPYESTDENYSDIHVRVMDELSDAISDLALEEGLKQDFEALHEGKPFGSPCEIQRVETPDTIESERDKIVSQVKEKDVTLGELMRLLTDEDVARYIKRRERQERGDTNNELCK